MKRNLTALLLLLALLLTGCAAASGIQTVDVDGVLLEVDVESGQISDGQYVYSFSQESKTTTLVYPNGATHERYNFAQYVYHDSCDGDISGYMDPGKLYTAIERVPRQDGSMGISSDKLLVIVMGIGSILLGVFFCGAPESAWKVQEGWKFEDAKPSRLALAWNQVAGVIMMIVGMVVILVGIFGNF